MTGSGISAPDANGDLHDTATSYFLVMIANGKPPNVVFGGDLDGLRYFVTEIDGREYWVTERVGPHTLRHSAATAWLEGGVSLKAVSELLGHADIRITADCYGHVTEAASRAAMDQLASVLGL